MKPETEKRLKKIKRMSNVLRVICKVWLAVAICGFLAALVVILTGVGTVGFLDNSVSFGSVTLPVRLVLAVITALTMGVGLKGFYHLYRLLGNYGRGDIFTTESAGHIRQLGFTVLLWYGVNILWSIAIVQAHLRNSVQFNSDSLVTGPIIIVISWFMEMAAEMREENELTI